ncbi:DNA polymerase III subunit chi [Azoarcus olearius]|uniref:DNA-directed DNA polymerase n=1 Tax=Azoarcus sp. (strain BH72) TaxID=418699 RepID=A1K9L6_AZOSB|nr:DNA polymerase III subunit chi [Azoarcus olearius]ANQ86073.1 DNA-directed DNA polymerase [Azoarcus olearius]CAL95521.1 DNA-directed DNA polymerase [Azoarcus olearius]
MTKVQFYHNAPDQLALACELVAKAQAGGRQVAVRAADPAMARKLDLMLWTVEPLAFVPHVMNGGPLADETPVQIGAPGSDARWPHADILFNLAADLAPGFEGFRTVVEIVGRSEAEKAPARARWTQYKTRGLPLKAFDAERRVAL